MEELKKKKETPESEFVKLGKQLLEGKQIKQINLRGKTYQLHYTEEEFRETALKSGWPEWLIEVGFKGGTVDAFFPALKGIKFPPYQAVAAAFISDMKSHFCLNSGGYGSGKSLALYIKLILFLKCFPGNRILLGRKTLSDIDRAVLPDLFELMPHSWYEHRVKDGLININNGSQIVLFGLDAMQTGGVADIKKAQQKLKSLNLGAYFIDQLEEVEADVFEVLNSRLRRADVPVRQGNMTTNPANFWAYEPFVANKKDGYHLFESSMLHNPHLPADYVLKQLGSGVDYVKRFVIGTWTTDVLLKGTVFAREHISFLEGLRRAPLAVEEGCEIYEQPVEGTEYRMGVDPSEGVVDPSSISVVSSNGRKVAKFNGKIPIIGLADKVKFLYYKYRKPLIVPESNAAGAALIREIRDLRVYKRKQTEYKEDRETEKLGFRTSWETKQQLISHFQTLLRDKVAKVYDKKTVEEMKTFIWTNEATHQGAGAARGFHDDDIMSTLLAYWEFNPRRIEEIRVAQTRPTKRKRFQYT